MILKSILLMVISLGGIFCSSILDALFFNTLQNQPAHLKNNRPEVKIIEPENNSTHSLNSLIRYTINVSDVEDGESKYNEIPSGKVYLKIIYREGNPSNSPPEENFIEEEPPGLTLIKNSDCFNCHQLKSKLIGPSFQEIANRYSNAEIDRRLLATRIQEGSTGIWGELIMPAHNDLRAEEAEKIIDWILMNGSRQNLNILVGDKGTLKLEIPDGAKGGYFTLTASYTDNGSADNPGNQLLGEDMIILRYF